MPEKKPKKKPGAPRKRRKLAGQSVGLAAKELATASLPNAVEELQSTVERDGGKVLTAYREPYGGKWLVMAALPIDQVSPPISAIFGRAAQARRVIAKFGRFRPDHRRAQGEQDSQTRYWTPNGNHRCRR
jgi:ParB family chromosome partitioning protein